MAAKTNSLKNVCNSVNSAEQNLHFLLLLIFNFSHASCDCILSDKREFDTCDEKLAHLCMCKKQVSWRRI
jgi:hypothetical protein